MKRLNNSPGWEHHLIQTGLIAMTGLTLVGMIFGNAEGTVNSFRRLLNTVNGVESGEATLKRLPAESR